MPRGLLVRRAPEVLPQSIGPTKQEIPSHGVPHEPIYATCGKR